MKLIKLKTGDKKDQTENFKTLGGLGRIKEDNNCGEAEVIADNLFLANTFFKKLTGLIFRKKLKDREGIVIENCKSIHTFGMRYNIDAVFLDDNNRVVAIFQNIVPFRITPFLKNASKVVELRSGTIRNTSLKVGDVVSFIED